MGSPATRALTGRRRSPERLQQEIGEIQARLTDTVDALRHRLAPRQLRKRVRNMYTNTDSYRDSDAFRDSDSYRTSDRGRQSQRGGQIGGMLRDNAMPLALIGLGLGWAMLSGTGAGQRMSSSSSLRRLRDKAAHAADNVRHRVGDAVETVRHSAEDVRDKASDALQRSQDRGEPGADDRAERQRRLGMSRDGGGRHLMANARTQARQYTQSFWQMVDEHPIVAGLMGMALGGAVGASLPSTEVEQRWMGEYSDDVMEKTKELSREAADRAVKVAEAGTDAARREADQQAAEVRPETAGTGI